MPGTSSSPCRFVSFYFLLLMILFVCRPGAAQDRKSGIQVSCGDMTLTYGTHAGVRVVVHGMELIRGNSLYVMKPGWAGRIYGLSDSPDVFETARVEEAADGSKTITLTLETPEDTPNPFSGILQITMTPENSLEWNLNYELEEGTDAIMEFGVAQLNVMPLVGSVFEAETWNEEDISGTVPVEAPGPEPEESTLANSIREMTIHSRIGPIEISANEPANIRLFDYRKNVWATDEKPIFWLGQLAHDIPAGRDMTYSARIDFPDEMKPLSETVDRIRKLVPVRETDSARMPNYEKRPVIPAPKEMEETGAPFVLTPKTKIYVGPNSSEESDKAVAFLMRDLREKYDLYPEVIRRKPSQKDMKNVLFIGENSRMPMIEQLLLDQNVSLPEDDEGYVLNVGENQVLLTARTGRGVFYGITSLTQLLTPSAEGPAFRGAQIRDWPSLDFRGVHAFSGKNRGCEIAKAVRDLLARYKMNNFVWETEYIIWNSHPDIAHPEFGMTKADAAQVVQAADENLVRLIPLIQSLGHSEYIFVHGHNMEIAEDPETPYSYSPENPATYEFIFDLYAEALEFFDYPEFFHIGHDEVTMTGRFPWRSRSSGKSAYQLVLEDIDRLHEWFSKRDVHLMMWSDMFLGAGDAPDATHAKDGETSRVLRAQLPKDIIITDWHYDAVRPEDLTSLSLWRDESFDVIGSSWYSPINIRSQALASIEAGTMGLLQTTWAGYNFKIEDHEAAWFQYWVYILAAHYAWSGDHTMPADLPWQAREVFLDTWFEKKPLLTDKAGIHFDLSPVANRSLTDSGDGSGWLGYGERLDMSSFDPSQTQFGTTTYGIRENDKGDAAVLLAGRLNPEGAFPETVVLEPEKTHPVSELHFLMASAFAGAEGEKAGEIEVTYSDGDSEILDLIYGKNLFSISTGRQGRDARIAWTGETQSGDRLRLWSLPWELRHAGKELSEIEIRSENTVAAPVIFGITGVGEAK